MPCVSEPVLVMSHIRTAECETNVLFVIFLRRILYILYAVTDTNHITTLLELYSAAQSPSKTFWHLELMATTDVFTFVRVNEPY